METPSELVAAASSLALAFPQARLLGGATLSSAIPHHAELASELGCTSRKEPEADPREGGGVVAAARVPAAVATPSASDRRPNRPSPFDSKMRAIESEAASSCPCGVPSGALTFKVVHNGMHALTLEGPCSVPSVYTRSTPFVSFTKANISDVKCSKLAMKSSSSSDGSASLLASELGSAPGS